VPANVPTIRIVSPDGSSELNTTSPELEVEVTNFTLDPDHIGDSKNEAGKGHYHVYLDGAYLLASGEEKVTLPYIGAGAHTIAVHLANNDHSELSPLTADLVSVTVSEDAPSIEITSPESGTVNSSSVSLHVAVENLTLDPAAVGKDNEEGHGHYHVFVDGEYYDYNATEDFVVSDLTPGDHVIEVELVNNDHSSLDPRVVDYITVNVSGSAPSIKIVGPTDKPVLEGDVNASSLSMKVDIKNFTIDPNAVGQDNEDGKGHFHIYVDGTYFDFATTTEFLVTDLTPGPHLIAVELVNNDHTSLESPVIDTLHVTIAANAASVNITSPKAGSSTANSSVTVAVDVKNFTLDAANFGKDGTNAPGKGHYHVFVDGVYITAAATSSVTIEVAPGNHVLSVELVNNDHSELATPVYDYVKFTVTSPK
jgi:hypothetical protein